MKKPEKKLRGIINMGFAERMERHMWFFNSGYNEAIDDYEKWLKEKTKKEAL